MVGPTRRCSRGRGRSGAAAGSGVSFLLYNGQAISYLASDPLGKGWDLFGTAGNGINYGVITATGIWYGQVTALVTGHVCGLVLAHDRALSVYARLRDAGRSTDWMLA